jgi:methionine sulfoxide reductase heme-binding subunit
MWQTGKHADLGTVLIGLAHFYIRTSLNTFPIFVPLAVTFIQWSVGLPGSCCKWLRRWTYAAAVLALVHWAAL